MSESRFTDKEFFSMMANLGTDERDDRDAERMPLLDTTIAVNRLLGSGMRHDLLHSVEHGLSLHNELMDGLVRTPFTGEIELEEPEIVRAVEIMNARLKLPTAAVRLGGWVALHGEAVLEVGAPGAGIEQGNFRILEVDQTSNVFGRLTDAAYSMYVIPEPIKDITDEEVDTAGLVVALEDVVICDAIYGRIQAATEIITVPLAAQELEFYRAEISHDLGLMLMQQATQD